MFKVNPNPTFNGEAAIVAPGGEVVTLKLVFKHKTRDEAKAFFERAAKSDEKESKLVMEIVAGWEGADEPFSEENLAQVLQNYHGSPSAIFHGYMEALTTARRGN